MTYTDRQKWRPFAEMEKAYKIAHAKLRVWKISTQNMCKKCPTSCKMSKNGQNFTKKCQKPLTKRMEKPKISTAVKN